MVFLYSKPLVVRKFNGKEFFEACNHPELKIDEEYQLLKDSIQRQCISFSIIK